MARLRRVDCSGTGIRRITHGRGFRYEDEAGDRLTDGAALERIRRLAIPPAWTDVWVCPDPQGHIQATGYDDAGRKQYLYHDVWRAKQDRRKFDQMLELAEELPPLRRAVKRRLGARGFTRDRVLAGAVRLLDLGFFRIGTEQYAEENESYGLATIRRSHVRSENGAVVFDYPAKSSQRRVQEISDPQLVALVRALKGRKGARAARLPRGQALGGRALRRGQCLRQGARWARVHRQGLPHVERDGARRGAARRPRWRGGVEDGAQTHRPRGREAGRGDDGNTPAVCRRAYIDPRVFDRFDSGATIESALRDGTPLELDELRERDRERIERAVVELLS